MSKSMKHPNVESSMNEIITIRFIPDESTKLAMKNLESKNFKKQIARDSKIISSHKIIKC